MADNQQTLPRPQFIEREAAAIIQRLVSDFEKELGKTLYPAQVERLLVNLVAYSEVMIRNAIQYTGEMCLVEYATDNFLDHLGRLVGTPRLPASTALTTLRFTLTQPQTVPIIVPARTRVRTNDSRQVFRTSVNVIIPAGEVTGDVEGEALNAGSDANGYAPGDIDTIIDPIDTGAIAFERLVSVQNITPTAGGAEPEPDDRYRTRIKLAPEKFTVAGSRGMYEALTLEAHPSVIAVGVRGKSLKPEILPDEQPPDSLKSEIAAIANGNLTGVDFVNEIIRTLDQTPWVYPGVVEIYPLLDTGLPSNEIKQLIYDYLDPRRDTTAWVKVLDPVEVQYSVNVSLILYRWAKVTDTKALAETALHNLIENNWKRQLGRDVVRSQLIDAVQSVFGVYRVDVISPSADLVLKPNQWGNCTNIEVIIAGEAEG